MSDQPQRSRLVHIFLNTRRGQIATTFAAVVGLAYVSAFGYRANERGELDIPRGDIPASVRHLPLQNYITGQSTQDMLSTWAFKDRNCSGYYLVVHPDGRNELMMISDGDRPGVPDREENRAAVVSLSGDSPIVAGAREHYERSYLNTRNGFSDFAAAIGVSHRSACYMISGRDPAMLTSDGVVSGTVPGTDISFTVDMGDAEEVMVNVEPTRIMMVSKTGIATVPQVDHTPDVSPR